MDTLTEGIYMQLAILGQSQDAQCNLGIYGHSDSRYYNMQAAILGQSQDVQCNLGIYGYSDSRYYMASGHPQTVPGCTMFLWIF